MSDVNGVDEKTKKLAEHLYQVLFFNIFSIDDLCSILKEERLIKWKKFAIGKHVFKQGDFDQHFYIVIRGTINIRKTGANGKEVHMGTIKPGEVLGEMVVIDPAKARRAGAVVSGEEEAFLCEFDGTLMEKVSAPIRTKFLKKFLDLIVDRFDAPESKLPYYQTLVEWVGKQGIVPLSEYFSYSIETAVSVQNRLTQYIKYTDYLIARKVDPAAGYDLLKGEIIRAIASLDKTFEPT